MSNSKSKSINEIPQRNRIIVGNIKIQVRKLMKKEEWLIRSIEIDKYLKV